MDDNKLKNALQRIPDVVKGWLGLIVAIAGIVIALRTDKQLYSVIIIGSILAVWLFAAIYLASRYKNYRWAGFLSIGAVIGIIFSFSIFTPNRQYVYEAFIGTQTPTPSPTFTPFTASPTLTPPLTEAPTLTPIPTLSPTSTTEPLRPTPTPIILFYDNFSDNSNGWKLGRAQSLANTNSTTVTRIIRGVLEYQMYCEPKSPNKCQTWIQVPTDRKKNFDLSFDFMKKQFYLTLPDSRLVIFIKFRDASQNYIIKFSNDGYISMYLNGTTPVTDEPIFTKYINMAEGEINSFKIVAEDKTFTVYAKDGDIYQKIIQIEDGNNVSSGTISLGIELKNDSGAIVEFDNILIQEVQ